MGKKKVLKGKRFFDTLYVGVVPKDLVKEWGHKEKVRECYAVIDEDEYQAIKKAGRLDLEGYLHYSNEVDAKQEVKDQNDE